MFGIPRHSDDEKELLPPQYRPPRRRFHSMVRSTALTIFTTVLTVLLVFYVCTIIAQLVAIKHSYRRDNSLHITNNQKPIGMANDELDAFDCGATIEMAIARKCPFDIMSNLWTPPHCYNSTFALESLDGVEVQSTHGGVGAPEFGLEEFQWSEDEQLSRPIRTAQELEQFLVRQNKRGLPAEAFTHMSFHAAHCSYLARVATAGLNRVCRGESDVYIPEVAADPAHARHCEHVFGELYRLSEGEARRSWTKVGFGVSPCVRIG